MILTVTLNPCIDHCAEVERLVPGGTNRFLSSRRDPSGKGVNVSTVLHELGAETLCLGVSREENAGLLESVLEMCIRDRLKARNTVCPLTRDGSACAVYIAQRPKAVSYTHLDVYKRQPILQNMQVQTCQA